MSNVQKQVNELIVPSVSQASPWYSYGTRRYVLPYFYTFQVFAKGRWVGRSLVDVFSAEFKHHQRQYYERAVSAHRLWISGGNTSNQDLDGACNASDNIICDGCVISHTVHKHELSVLRDATVVVERFLLDNELLVVTKPASVPTHPSGRYHLNSVVMMLEYVLSPGRIDEWLDRGSWSELVSCEKLPPAEREQLRQFYKTNLPPGADQVMAEKKPRACHRLDKTTSGVVIFAVSSTAAKRVGNHLAMKSLEVERQVARIRSAEADFTKPNEEKGENSSSLVALLVRSIPTFGIRKKYMARVCGKFPSNAVFDSEIVSVDGGVLILKGLGSGVVRKRGRDDEDAGDEDGGSWQKRLQQPQDAATFVRLARYDPQTDESVVECCPMTGRTHQIRIHLSMAGHPITNDVLYNMNFAVPTEKVFFSVGDLPPEARARFQLDELCAECIGEIPVTTVGDEGSQVYLHAAEYEVTLEDGRRETFSSTLPRWADETR